MRKHPTKAVACCNDGKLFFMERWISLVVVKDAEVEINHYIDLFGVKRRKVDLVEAVQACGSDSVKEYHIRIAYVGYACYNFVFGIKEEIEKFS